MSDQNAEKRTPTDSAGEKAKSPTNDAGARNRDTSLNPPADGPKGKGQGPAPKDAAPPQEPAKSVAGKGTDALDAAAAVAKGYVTQTGENVKDALLSPATPLGALVNGVKAVVHVAKAENKTEAIKQEVRAEAKTLHEALPGTAAREAGYAGLNDARKGATADQVVTSAADAALKRAPFVQTVDHLEKAQAASAKGDSTTAAKEYGKAVASFTGEVVQTTLALEGAARGGRGAPPAAAENPGGKGNTQRLPAAADGGKGNTQRLPAAPDAGKGQTQPLPGPGGEVSPMAKTLSPLATTQAPGEGSPRQVRIDGGGQPHAKTEVAAGPREGAAPPRGGQPVDRPSLNDTQRMPVSGSDATLRLSPVDLAGKQIIDLQRNGTAYHPDGRPTPQMQAAMKVIEDHVMRVSKEGPPQR